MFVSYAREDQPHCAELKKTFADLQREGLVALWTDAEMLPGEAWDQHIQDQLQAADVILLLVSRDFLASEYIDRVELAGALARHKQGSCRVVPVIVRKCDWEGKLGKLNALPPGGKPISTYTDPDEAWYDIRRALKRILL